MGTSYHAYIEAIFDKNFAKLATNILKSWILIAMTKGVGPDARMFYLVFMLYSNNCWSHVARRHILMNAVWKTEIQFSFGYKKSEPSKNLTSVQMVFWQKLRAIRSLN